MGYACPICETPQRDGEHLAHHLAFTAMLHGDEHEEWLAERAPDWQTSSPEELAAIVTEDAEETEYHEVFEDTTDRDRGHRHDHDTSFEEGFDPASARSPGGGAGASNAETQEIIEEARELTREMMEPDDSDADDGADARDTDSDSATPGAEDDSRDA